MAKFTCKCGSLLSNSVVPNDIELYVFSDFEWDEIIRKDVIDPIKLPRPKYQVWKCPDCSRIYVFSEDGKGLKKYKIEED